MPSRPPPYSGDIEPSCLLSKGLVNLTGREIDATDQCHSGRVRAEMRHSWVHPNSYVSAPGWACAPFASLVT